MEACGCLPGCVDLYYEINQNYQPVADAQHQKSLVQFEIFFDDKTFYPYYRSELQSFSQLLANTGGLLGLFLGFSFLSIVELVYFICIACWGLIKPNSVRGIAHYRR
ncbi:Pickpocket protein 28 [Blattella germanica]|nr:Pickpocket protein 28 [Blattella germanica]